MLTDTNVWIWLMFLSKYSLAAGTPHLLVNEKECLAEEHQSLLHMQIQILVVKSNQTH